MKTLTKTLIAGFLLTSQIGFTQVQSSRTINANCGGYCNDGYVSRTQIDTISNFVSWKRLDTYMVLVSDLRDYVTPQEYSEFIYPLKSSISSTQMTLETFGPLHAETAKSFLTLVANAERSSVLFNDLEMRDAFFETIQDLKRVIMQIKRATIN